MSAVQTTPAEDLSRWEDEGGAVPTAPAAARDAAAFSWGADRLAAAIAFDLERGREDVARRYAGDDAVDKAIAADLGITVEQLRTPGFLDGINGFESAA